MSTAEHLAFSIKEQIGGVHILLWDEKEDLFRTLLILLPALGKQHFCPILLSSDDAHIAALRSLVDARCPLEEELPSIAATKESPAKKLWLLFVQQASTKRVGPWLNGWRRPLSDGGGTLLVVRSADFEAFQRAAPDLSSFAGPRIYDSSTMLSVISKETEALANLPDDILRILAELPGTLPSNEEILAWIKASTRENDEQPSDR